MIKKVLSFINRISPKSNIVIFNSFPDVSDNSVALYKYIIENRKDITNNYKLYWTVSKSPSAALEMLKGLNKDYPHRVIRKKSLIGIWLFFRAKYLISTHGYFGCLGGKNSQIHINLWHGMPFKTIGKGIASDLEINADYTIATSAKFREVMAFSFGINSERVLLTGLPRNDFLLIPGFGLNRLDIPKKFNKVIIWMPTYRQSVVGELRNDGNINGFGVKELLINDLESVSSILKKNNYLLIIKLHPMDKLCDEIFPSDEYIRIINDQQLREKGILLYQLLADTDVLITDYSSVFIDYLITGKPIAFACSDFNEYQSTRGFSFDNAKDYLPGELLETKEQFVDYLSQIDEYERKWKEKYRSIQEVFNPLMDSLSSQRVCEEIWGEC